jgi:hypothetical protein
VASHPNFFFFKFDIIIIIIAIGVAKPPHGVASATLGSTGVASYPLWACRPFQFFFFNLILIFFNFFFLKKKIN